VRLRVSGGLGLVSDDDIAEGDDLVDLSLEELRDERSRKVHGEALQSRKKRASATASRK
jgi:hypothetical protein